MTLRPGVELSGIMLTFKRYRFGSISDFELGMLNVDHLQSKEALVALMMSFTVPLKCVIS